METVRSVMLRIFRSSLFGITAHWEKYLHCDGDEATEQVLSRAQRVPECQCQRGNGERLELCVQLPVSPEHGRQQDGMRFDSALLCSDAEPL